MKQRKLLKIDFEKVANTLMNETHQGQVHLDICEGLTKVDPYILNHTPVFWQYTIWGHMYCAMMYAIKLFDTHGDAYTVPKFLKMAKLRADKFAQGSAKEVHELVADGELEMAALQGTITELRRRRNHILAHISEELVLREKQERERILTIEQVRTVLLAAGKIVNSLTIKWAGFITLGFPSTDDYSRVVSMVNDYLCKQAEQHDEEFAKYGEQFKLPPHARPRSAAAT
jgi:hypothetical protein